MPRRISKNRDTPAPPRALRQRRLTEHFKGTSSQKNPSGPVNQEPSEDLLNPSNPGSHSDANGSDSSDNVAAIKFEKFRDNASDSPKRRRSPRSSVSTTQLTSPIERACVALTPESDPDSSPVAKPRKGKSRAVPDDDDEEVQPRRKILRVRPPSPEEENESDLADEIDQDQIIEARFRTRDKKSIYQKNLEKLRRKKLGKNARDSPQESSDYSQGNSDEDVEPFEGAKPDNDGNSDGSKASEQSLEGEDDSWMVDDADEELQLELPAAFSMNSHQDLAHQFKIICQLFVHLAVTPLGDRRTFMENSVKDEYFAVPLFIMRRKLDGIRDSSIQSSQWKPEYINPLRKYPTLNIAMLEFTVPGCDACGMSGRKSTRAARLSGFTYDKLTFEQLEDDSPDEGESDEDTEDEQGKKRRREYHLGRFCAARTRAFHEFCHWEYALFNSLSSEIQDGQQDKSGYVSVAYLGGLQPPEDSQDADAYMDWLDERHVIETEWIKIKEMMERANNLEMNGKGDDYLDD